MRFVTFMFFSILFGDGTINKSIGSWTNSMSEESTWIIILLRKEILKRGQIFIVYGPIGHTAIFYVTSFIMLNLS
jgi:hypothetical protein